MTYLPNPLTPAEADDFASQVIELMKLRGSMRPVHGNWTDWFDTLRHNYRMYAAAVERGLVSWKLPCDPYIVADWAILFTPIEAAIWSDIRCYGLPFWPQFPVGRFIADFADPLRKIALECDGAAYHDSKRDRMRDAEFEKMGWTVYRIPGRDCFDENVVLRDFAGRLIALERLR